MADKHGAEKHIDDVTGVETTGHEWDGICELNNPMPRWWVWTFYATIVWGIGYMIAYPAWPMLTEATRGVLGYSSRAEVAKELQAAKAAQTVFVDRIAAAPLADIVTDPELSQFAIAGGAAAFKVNCVQCHGSGAAGSAGFPNLNDDDWIWAAAPTRSTRPSPMASVSKATPTRMFPKCPHSTTCCSRTRSSRLPLMWSASPGRLPTPA